MNTNNQTMEMNKRMKAVSSTSKLARKTSPSLKKFGRVGEKPGNKSSSGASSRCQEARLPETTTVVEAKIDVGLGNALYIRGQGNGLSWEKGQALSCVAPSTWVWAAAQAKDKVVFKLLLNDVIWAKGEDILVEAGHKVEIVPGF